MKKTNLLGYAAVSSLAMALMATPAAAQVDEIIVTATKRAENAQDVAVAVTALGEKTLEENDVDVFTDYLLQLPNVNASSSGPGQGTIYVRGIASSSPTTTTAVAAGLAPNVALYLDDQPVTQVGRNLDVYAVDLNRIEVLPGPQGTLFGASSQAGTIRLITNKPKLGVEEAKASFGISFTEGGEMSTKGEATYNLPIGDNFALRGTVFGDVQGGYIDNVAGVADIRDNAAFFPTGTILANGASSPTALYDGRYALPLGDPNYFDGLNGGTASNENLVEDNYNDTTYTGFRIGGLYEFNSDWSLNLTHMQQKIDSDGVFFADPNVDDDLTSIQRYADEYLDDEFANTAWTLEGRLGMLDMVYTGAFNAHDFDQRIDYTDYGYVGPFIPYYTCNYYNVYYAGGNPGPTGECNDPRLFADIENETTTQTHELRFNTPADRRMRATVGGFFSDQEVIERVDFTYPGSIPNNGGNATPGFGGFAIPNAPISISAASDPTARDPGVVFINDITRTDEQYGLFAEGSFDISDTLTFTGGLRYYDVSVDMVGSSNNISTNALGRDLDQGFNLGDIFDGNDTFINFQGGARARAGGVADTLPFDPVDAAETSGVNIKGNISWEPNDDQLFYLTYSEGFRPGVLNRPAIAVPDLIQAEVRTDELTNYEFGWKTRLMDNQLQFNGNIFFVDISDLQTTIFDPSVGTNLLFSSNAANAEVKGLEADFIWAPSAMEGLTVNGAVSVLDSKIKEILQQNASGGITIAIAPTGSDLAYAPKFQGNLRARYEWPETSGGMTPHVQLQGNYSAKSYSDIVLINRAEQDSYFLMSGAAGVKKDRWGLEVFVENLTDERAELNNNFNFNRERITINRPRTWGMRLSVDFGQ